MIIPEVTIYNLLKAILAAVRIDHLANGNASLLSRLLDVDDNNVKIQIETYEYLKQGINVFTADVDKSRRLTLNIGYNLEVGRAPAIHILMPNESDADVSGMTHESDEWDEDEQITSFDSITHVKTTSLSNGSMASYALMITSDNSTEVVLIYQVLKALVTLYRDEFSVLGFNNLKMTGSDIVMQSELVPPNIFHRNLSLSFSYQSNLTKKYSKIPITNFKVHGLGMVKSSGDYVPDPTPPLP
jgi:hypothetical protein